MALLGGHGAHVALMDKPGAHAWHCQMGMEHIHGTDGQGAHVWHRQRLGLYGWHCWSDWGHTRGTAGWAWLGGHGWVGMAVPLPPKSSQGTKQTSTVLSERFPSCGAAEPSSGAADARAAWQ